jgi:MoaA/NifB/PqqE/SkfB family radical SAM enzyme
MSLKIAARMVRELSPKVLFKATYNLGWKGIRAVSRYEKRAKRGEHYPAFMVISLTNQCNLNCQGCWVHQSDPPQRIEPDVLERIIAASKSQGSYFFGLLGGEPLLYEGLFDVLARHPDCYFQLFTNGTLITDALAARMAKLGNITPLISVEGLEQVSDERRGGEAVFERTLDGIRHCVAHKLMTGVATSVCRSNMTDLVSREFLERLVELGVHYAWYYIYRPVGAKPCPQLCLSKAQILELRRFIVDARDWAPLMVVDAYWDHDGNAVCPAAMGISHHIGPTGFVEPCPIIQTAKDHIGDGSDLVDLVNASSFIPAFKRLAVADSRGCILLDDPTALRDLAVKAGAADSSGRDTVFDELAVMRPRPGHDMPGDEIPDRNWFYRFAKKNWFFGFGAYG